MSTPQLCLIENPDELGSDLVARRLHDDIAVVVSVTSPEFVQRFGDRILLEGPEPGEQAPRSRTHTLRRFHSRGTVLPGGFRTDRLTAPHPGHQALLRLDRIVAERRWGLAVRPVPGDSDGSGRAVAAVRPLIELWLASPETVSAVEIDALLGVCTDHWMHPPAYAGVMARAGGDVELHRARAESYRFTGPHRRPAGPRRW